MVGRMGQLARLRKHYQLFDSRFYRHHNGLPGLCRGVLGFLHFHLLGDSRGLDPSPLFSSAFVQRQRALAGEPLLDLPFSRYVDDPALWRTLDPHPAVFSRGEPFSPRHPEECPLKCLDAPSFAWGDGAHPLVASPSPARSPDAPASPWPDGSLGRALQGLAEEMGSALHREDPIALARFDVLLMAGDHHCPACAQYRVHNFAHALRAAGMRVAVLYADDIPRIQGFDISSRVLFISRPLWRADLAAFIADQRAKGARVAFECDDILFDFPHVLGIQFDEAGRLATWNVNHHSELCTAVLREADFGVFPTRLLGDVAMARNPGLDAAAVVPSFLSDGQLDRAAGIARVERNDGEVVLAYSSGTWTHSADFSSIVPALAAVLDRRPQVRLRVNGLLDVNRHEPLRGFVEAGRVVHDPRVLRDWGEHIQRLAEADVNVVPLEIDNGFCHAKSEVRYIEAGSVGVPTVASPTEAYRRAIDHGVNGMLATGAEEWVDALLALVDHPARRVEMGRAARADVHDRYSVRGPYADSLVDVIRSRVEVGSSPADDTTSGTTPSREGPSRVAGILAPGVGGAGEWRDISGARLAAVTPEHVGAAGVDEGEILVLRTHADVARARETGALSASARTAAIGPQLHATVHAEAPGVVMGMPGHDPGVFFRRSTPSPSGAVLVDVPYEACLLGFGDGAARALSALADGVGDALGTHDVVLMCPGRSHVVPRRTAGIEGFASSVEFATLIRQSPVLVVLDEGIVSPAVSAALMCGTPVMLARAADAGVRLERVEWADDPELASDLARASELAFPERRGA